MKTVDTDYVNPFGKPIARDVINTGLRSEAKRKPVTKAAPPDEYHKGWKVVGIPPGAVEEAKQLHDKAQQAKPESQRQPFRREHWIANRHGKPVRPSPYSVKSAAEVCADLARKAGWLNVQVVEVAKRKEVVGA